jgi:hypothetical protein
MRPAPAPAQPELVPETQPQGLSRGTKTTLGVAGLLAPSPASQQAVSTSSTGSALFQPVAANEVDHAIAALIMSDADKAKARQAVQQGRMKLAWINVSDSEVEDGDWVRISAGGLAQDVRLFKNPLRVAVPYVPGSPVTVTGLIDGDGASITVAVHFGGSIFGLKPLRAGETVLVPSP